MTTGKKIKETVPRWLWVEGEKFYLNSEKTAEFFSVSERTLLNWNEKSGGALKKDTGWWDTQAIMEWLSKESSGSDAARKLKAEADLKEEQVAAKRLENAIERGEYLKKSEVSQEWATRIIELKNSLLALAKLIGSLMTDPNLRIWVERVITEKVYEFLEQYSRTGKYTPKQTTKRGRKK